MSLILPMCAFALAASISPGPVNIVCLSSGTRYPIATGLTFVTGATLSFIVLFIAVGLGLYSLLTMVPGLQSVLRWAGVAFFALSEYQVSLGQRSIARRWQQKGTGLHDRRLDAVVEPQSLACLGFWYRGVH